MAILKPGTNFRHNKKGNEYRVICVVNVHADDDRKDEYPTLVVYRDQLARKLSRPLEDFLSSFSQIIKA